MKYLYALVFTICLITVGSTYALYDATQKGSTVISIQVAQSNEPLNNEWLFDELGYTPRSDSARPDALAYFLQR